MDPLAKAARDAEYRAMREAYRQSPDSPADADDWSTAEEFNPAPDGPPPDDGFVP